MLTPETDSRPAADMVTAELLWQAETAETASEGEAILRRMFPALAEPKAEPISGCPGQFRVTIPQAAKDILDTTGAYADIKTDPAFEAAMSIFIERD